MATRPVASAAEAALLEEVHSRGAQITLHQLRRVADGHLLPKPTRRGLGRGRGMQVVYPEGTAAVLEAWSRLRRPERGYTAAIALYSAGLPIPTNTYRSAQARWHREFVGSLLPEVLSGSGGGQTIRGAIPHLMKQSLAPWVREEWESQDPSVRADKVESPAAVAASVIETLLGAVLPTMGNLSHDEPSKDAWVELLGAFGLDKLDRGLASLEPGDSPDPTAGVGVVQIVLTFLRPSAVEAAIQQATDEELNRARYLSRMLLRGLSDMAYLISFGISGAALPRAITQDLRSGLRLLRAQVRFDPVLTGALLIPLVLQLSSRFPEDAQSLESTLGGVCPILEARTSFIRSLPSGLRDRLRRAKPIAGGYPPALMPELQPAFASWATNHPGLASRLISRAGVGETPAGVNAPI